MQTSLNEHGQTVLHLTKEEWTDYGRLAGYMPEVVKEASTEETVETAETTQSQEEEIASLRAQVADINEKLASFQTETVKESSTQEATTSNQGVNNQITVTENSSFTEENYPNLVAQQEQDGLIGPFAPRP